MTSAFERVTALVKELTAHPGYAAGTRPFPLALQRDEAVLIIGKLQDAVDEATEVRARKALEDGHRIACGAGCYYCCEQLIMAWLPEAMRVTDYLSHPANAEKRAHFIAAYPSWRERIGDVAERIADLTAERNIVAHVREHVAQWRRGVLCAFNHEGLCSIYEVRPMVCRTAHALDTNAHCRADTSSMIPAKLEFEPLDNFVGRANILNTAMHHALGGKQNRTVALCEYVYEKLTAAR